MGQESRHCLAGPSVPGSLSLGLCLIWKLDWGRIHFWAHLCGCWWDSVPRGLAGGGVRFSNMATYFIKCASPEVPRETLYKRYSICFVLFVKSQSLGRAHTPKAWVGGRGHWRGRLRVATPARPACIPALRRRQTLPCFLVVQLSSSGLGKGGAAHCLYSHWNCCMRAETLKGFLSEPFSVKYWGIVSPASAEAWECFVMIRDRF